MNLLILSVGARYKLVTYFKEKGSGFQRVITTDCSVYAPALYISDRYYIVPRMTEPGYLQTILEICQKEQIQAVLALQEEELELIAENRAMFENAGILSAVSPVSALRLCRDKYALYKHLADRGICAVPTYEAKPGRLCVPETAFPVFMKPRYGCGSAGMVQTDSRELLEQFVNTGRDAFVVQPFLEAEEYGADVYIDFISHKIVSIFVKKKIRMRAGETEKSVSVRDPEVFEFVEHALEGLPLRGPIDMDLFWYDGNYHVLEINPRFGGGYPHAHECGVHFTHMLSENAGGRINPVCIGDYREHVVLLKYSDVMIRDENDML